MTRPTAVMRWRTAFLGDALGEVGSEVVADEGAGGHEEGAGPVDEAARDEPAGGDEVDGGAEDGLQAVHLVDVGEPEESRGRPA